ncbi:MAG TPA: hypothetical protein VKR31_15050 [Rhizomicrobium sp.]|nr:hypothetical protein [Rhizomicrobium sp.]
MKGLEPPERVNEALDVRVMAMINAMKPRELFDSPSKEPLSYIPRDVLKQLPCEERLHPGLEVARSVQARFEESNRDLANGRSDVEFSDFEPDWRRYEGPGNLDLLEQPCVFSGELAALVQILNQDIALAELHNEIQDSERHLERNHPVLARRALNVAQHRLALLKKANFSGQRMRKFQSRVEAVEQGLEEIDGGGANRGLRRPEKELEGTEGAPRRERRRAQKELEASRQKPSREERRRGKKNRPERKRPLRSREQPGDGA